MPGILALYVPFILYWRLTILPLLAWYDRDVRELRIARAFVVFACIALLLLWVTIDPSAAHLHPAIPALVFCFFAVLTPSLLRVSDGNPAVQPISLLTIHISRAPPVA